MRACTGMGHDTSKVALATSAQKGLSPAADAAPARSRPCPLALADPNALFALFPPWAAPQKKLKGPAGLMEEVPKEA